MISEDALRPGPGPHVVQFLYDHAAVLEPRVALAALSRRRAGATIVPPDARGAVTIRHPERVSLRDPNEFLATAADKSARARALVNVRLFNIAGRAPGEMVMDTLGLTLLGLLGDVQAHFSDLDPGRVAPYLFDVAAYLLSRTAPDAGPILADGDFLPAPAADPPRWRVRHEMALMKPTRGVYDLGAETR